MPVKERLGSVGPLVGSALIVDIASAVACRECVLEDLVGDPSIFSGRREDVESTTSAGAVSVVF